MVAARSYARAQGRYSYAETCDTQACQVYGGAARRPSIGGTLTMVEQPNTDLAIETMSIGGEGIVRTSPSGAVVSTMFSSSSGGYTAPSDSPGFPAVVDDGDDVVQNPYHNWTTVIPVSTVERAWPAIGTLTQITVTKRNGLGAEGGRVVTMTVAGTSGQATITGDQFRIALGLRSNWFSVRGDQCSGRVEPTVTAETISTTGASNVVPANPVRVIDTRNGVGTTPIALGGGCTLAFDPGAEPAGAVAVAVVVTTTRSDGSGFTTAYPCGTRRPNVSAVQVLGSIDVPGTTVVPLGADGRICIYSSVTTDVLVDVLGWLAPGSGSPYRALAGPSRVLDSRQPGSQTRLAAGTVTRVAMPRSAGAVPRAASVNITATTAGSAGYVTAYPCDANRSETSVLNFRQGIDSANHAFVDLDGDGALCLWNSAAVNLIVDVDGLFSADPAGRGITIHTPQRLVDSRDGTGTTGALRPGEVRTIDLGEPSGGVLAQVAIVDPTSAGFLSLYPCDDPAGGLETSVANAPAGTNVANVVLLRTDGSGQICARSSMVTHLLVDVVGRV